MSNAPKIVVTRLLTETEVLRFFKIYKRHQKIIEAVDGGKTYEREKLNLN